MHFETLVGSTCLRLIFVDPMTRTRGDEMAEDEMAAGEGKEEGVGDAAEIPTLNHCHPLRRSP